MGIFRTRPKDFVTETIDNTVHRALKKSAIAQFNASVLGLGDINIEAQPMSSICAIFDLEGFTFFCKQIDPQLSVPIFLNDYLNWIFEKIRTETIQAKGVEGDAIWHEFPRMVKFMGDGLLVLWDTKGVSKHRQLNILLSMHNITKLYISDFYPKICKKVSDAPPRLRCGIAKGNVYSVGNGSDFVGPCINLASRLQKLPGVTFSFASRGFTVESDWSENNKSIFLLKKVSIRGMSEGELVYVVKKEYEALGDDADAMYFEP